MKKGEGGESVPLLSVTNVYESAITIILAGGALLCDHRRDVERAYTVDSASQKVAGRERLVSSRGRSRLSG